ncbi:MAG: hypothetical protein IJU48_08085 [Synergistaceae bacterium]|nr:hypothetical protein [Synergistaceae bacterium]
MNKKRPGASLMNVLVFMLAAMMITSQVFFFAENESVSSKEARAMMQVRMRLENLVQTAKGSLTPNTQPRTADYKTFHANIKLNGFPQNYWDKEYHVCIYDLDYTLQERPVLNGFKESEWENIPVYERIFPPMGADYYLIRAYTTLPAGNSLMLQVLIHNGKTLAYEEIWY